MGPLDEAKAGLVIPNLGNGTFRILLNEFNSLGQSFILGTVGAHFQFKTEA